MTEQLPETAQAMTLSHDRLVLQRAEQSGGPVVVVRCRDQRVAAEAIEALAAEAESWPDDSGDDSGGALAAWLRSRIPPGERA